MAVRRKSAEPQSGPSGERLVKGSVVAGYHVRRELERPRDSYVAYEAVKGSGGGRVVLKLVHQRLSQDKRFSSRLLEALRKQYAFSHPAMIGVLAGGWAEERLHVVTTLVRRPTLAETLEVQAHRVESGGLKPPRAMRVLCQIADLLEAAHKVDLVHGCLRADVISLGSRDEAFVDDFGMSRLNAREDPFVGPAILHGAPEQFTGEPASPRSDVYALAAVAYQCLTGALPYWHGPSSHDGKPPLPVARHSQELPPELDGAFARGLAEDPGDRHATVSELMRDLSGALVLWSAKPSAGATAWARGGRVHERALQARRRARAERDAAHPEVPAVTVWNDRAVGSAPHGDGPGGERVSVTRLHFVAATAALAVAAAAAGIVIMGRDTAEPPPKAPGTVRSGQLELTAPLGWERGAKSDFARLSFAQKPIALSGEGASRDLSLVAGSVAATGPTFVPPAVSSALAEALPRPDLVTLRGVRALRYSDVRPRSSSRVVTLYSVPTSVGVAMISCSTAAGGVSTAQQLARCERVAATLEIRGAQPVELLFSAQYGEVLTNMLTRLNGVRARERERLRRRGQQPEAARALALAYAEAGRTLAATEVPPDAEMHASIRRAFRRTRQAYAALAGAARRNDRLAYRRARQSVNDGERDIQAALKDFNTLGYTTS